jgi:hypothetical protein
MRGADQLPGPVLAEWLVHELGGAATAVIASAESGRGGTSGALRERVDAAARRYGWSRGGAARGSLAALVVITELGDAAIEPVVALACEGVKPGGKVIELAHPPVVRPWQVLRWLRRTRVMRSAAELRARAWLGIGLYAVEQWAPVDLPRVLVTCGVWRAIPMAVNGAIGKDTLWVEVSDERFTEGVQRSFKRVGEPRAVTAVDLDGDGPQPVRAIEPVADGSVTYGQAYACVVEDSGSGLVWLVYGGAAGLWIGAGGTPGPHAVFEAYLLMEREALVFADG